MNQFACIFDLDGVIVDTAKFHYIAWKRLANDLGFDFTEKQNELLKGISRKESLDIILDWGNIELPQEAKDQWLITKNNWYLEQVQNMTTDSILPGVKEFITEIKKAGIKTGLGSASKNATQILEIVGLKDVFDAIVDGNKTTKSKPDPQVFTLCADELGVDYKDCVVFEDAEAGIEAAIRAGMYPIGIGEKEILNQAAFVIPDLSEMSIEKLPFQLQTYKMS